LAAQIPNVSDRVLVERLKELEDEKIVVRTENPAAAIKVMYGLSEKGKALNSVMQEIQTWSDAWV
jgi:DNA-binding HxlR family transcriptional regulator